MEARSNGRGATPAGFAAARTSSACALTATRSSRISWLPTAWPLSAPPSRPIWDDTGDATRSRERPPSASTPWSPRGRIFEDITADPRILAMLDAFLRPACLLSASHAICIHPGEAAQSLHTDDSFYPVPRPRPAISISVIGAIDAFTAENGGTVIIPGSHLWSSEALRERLAGGRPAEGAIALEMPAGAIAVFQGTLVHGAGANRSAAPRLAFTSQYCEPWPGRRKTSFSPCRATVWRGCRRHCGAFWATTSCRRSWAR